MLNGKQKRDQLLVDLLQSQKISTFSNLLHNAPFTNSIKINKIKKLLQITKIVEICILENFEAGHFHLDFTNLRRFFGTQCLRTLGPFASGSFVGVSFDFHV
jgi:hypothetical protein